MADNRTKAISGHIAGRAERFYKKHRKEFVLVFFPLSQRTFKAGPQKPLNWPLNPTTHLRQEAFLAENTLPNESLIKLAHDEVSNAQYCIVACMTPLEKDPDDNPDAAKAVKLILWDVLEELNGLRAILPVVLPQPESVPKV
jgi:hypothetical protein